MEIKESMDPNNTDPGYRLGRLMAVLERMQEAALGTEVNASVVDRFFSSASATPAAVFPRLMKNFRHHARKAQDENPKWAVTLEKAADEILAPLSPWEAFPRFLPLEQQGLFVLGYHHQRHELYLSKEERARRAAADTPANIAKETAE
jgi:CRISPR-associated protein Csd1